jgi:ATP-dependent protease ClpP protease subunit
MTTAEVVRKSTDKDWWIPAIEAKSLGFFDEVV